MALGQLSNAITIRRLAAAARPAALIIAVGTFLAILGPFGSHSIAWPQIWFYWTGLIALGGVFGFGGGELIQHLFPRLRPAIAYAVIPIFVSIPVSLAILWMEGAFEDGPALREIAYTYPPVLIISAFVSAVAYAVDQITQSKAQEAGTSHASRPTPALTDKLPVGLRTARILSVSAEDHYLRVRTDAGEALILMRLSDAAHACETLDGARTHRSWWVARDAVREARKGDGRGVLILEDGTRAPVSRTYYPALRDSGWF